MRKLLIVGLGNPGDKYFNTRHNSGYRVIDYMFDIMNCTKDKYETQIDELDIHITKTNTMMNNSGAFVKTLIKNHNTSLWVIHDDMEVPQGSFKLKWGGSAAGHNGLRDINTVCGEDYGRMRIGIGRAASKAQAYNYVLENHTEKELAIISRIELGMAQFLADNFQSLYKKDVDFLRKKFKLHASEYIQK